MVRVTRAAYAEAFPAVTGRPLIKLPQTAGRSESEIFFDALALNAADLNAGGEAERLLEPFSAALAAALEARRDDLIRWVSARAIKELFVPPSDYRYPHMG